MNEMGETSSEESEQPSPPQPTPMSPPVPQGPRNDSEKNWGVFTHLSSLVFYVTMIPLAWFLAPLIVWLIKREEIPFVNDQGKEAMNFNLSLTIYGLAGLAFVIVTAGIGLLVAFPFWIALVIGHIVFTIMAAVAASRGELYRYPLTLRLIN